MKNEITDKINNLVSKTMKEENIDNYVSYFPMLRKENGKLYLGTLISLVNQTLSDRDKVVRPEYWLKNDVLTDSYELLKTSDKDYMDTNLIPLDKEFDDQFKLDFKDISLYATKKNIEYSNYLLENVKEDIITSQKNILDSINNQVIINNNKVSASDYLIANFEKELKEHVNELVQFVVNEKYSGIINYYLLLINNIIKEYKIDGTISNEKITLAANILENYYGEYCGIKYFFNI